MKIYSFLLLSFLALTLNQAQAMEQPESPGVPSNRNSLYNDSSNPFNVGKDQFFSVNNRLLHDVNIRRQTASGWNQVINALKDNNDRRIIEIGPIVNPYVTACLEEVAIEHNKKIVKQAEDYAATTTATIEKAKKEALNNLSFPRRNPITFGALCAGLGIGGLLAYQNPNKVKAFASFAYTSTTNFFAKTPHMFASCAKIFTRAPQVVIPAASTVGNAAASVMERMD